ncbi:MAG TPA: recombinase family protein [Thermoanaerobaculia bacterium]|nr:recombinase family protein [Thermoanaerobaculia bacterium]
MNGYYAYMRVSTAKQGEKGVSLQEQKTAIANYATRHSLRIIEWFEERETAAKRGRPAFNRIVGCLRKGKARGLIIHKIDRSARNLRDWADLGELIDAGVEIHFANESLDLQSRGGRLSADIQAVVAADFIRNLREETRKGFYGRLKQGLYPIPAPIGYLDRGKGKAKEIDPVKGPLVRTVFELYATGDYSLLSLRDELARLGLRNRNGKPLTINGVATLLHNPFYIGLIRIRKTNEMFAGIHEPLIPKSLFDRVGLILSGKATRRSNRNGFLFRRLFRCKHCGYSLVGERQKGRVYYRCHSQTCRRVCVREDLIEKALFDALQPTEFSPEEYIVLKKKVHEFRRDFTVERTYHKQALDLSLSKIKARLSGLLDVYAEGAIERDLFEERKQDLLLARKDIEEKMVEPEAGSLRTGDRMEKFLELTKSPRIIYESGNDEEKRNVVREATSNRLVDGKNVVVTLSSEFSLIQKRHSYLCGDPSRDKSRSGRNLPEKADSHEYLAVLLRKLYRLLSQK